MFIQIWDYQLLTLKIPLKLVLWDKHASFVKPYIDTQYFANSNIFQVNIFTFFILIQQLI